MSRLLSFSVQTTKQKLLVNAGSLRWDNNYFDKSALQSVRLHVVSSVGVTCNYRFLLHVLQKDD